MLKNTNLLYADKDLSSLERTVNSELKGLCRWLSSNNLTLNTQKSNFVIFCPRQKKVTHKLQINIHDTALNKSVPLENKDYVKYLGILVDKNLTWKMHIDNIGAKISKTVRLIAKLRHFVPFHTLLNIYRSLIMSYLTFGITCWGQVYNTYLNKILVLQKKALRFMDFVDRKTHAISLFLDAKILPVSFLYYRSTAVLLHDTHTNAAPKNLVNLFVNVSRCSYQ